MDKDVTSLARYRKAGQIQTLIVLPNEARNKEKSNKKQIKLSRLTRCYCLFFIKKDSNIPQHKA